MNILLEFVQLEYFNGMQLNAFTETLQQEKYNQIMISEKQLKMEFKM